MIARRILRFFLTHNVILTQPLSLALNGVVQNTDISKFTEFSMDDQNGHQLAPVSAVCTVNVTLYMFTKS